jgi:hypothetical protein
MFRFAVEAAMGALIQGQFFAKLLEEWGGDTQEFFAASCRAWWWLRLLR